MLRIRDVYPGSWFLPIPDPGSWISDPGSKNSNKREGWKKLVVITFYVATNFTKLQIILVLKCWRKKFGPILKEFFTQKIVNKLSKIWVWDPGSGIRDPGSWIRKKPIPDPGSRGQKGTGSRIRIRNIGIFSTVNFFPLIFGHQKPKFGLVFSLKCWILIRIKWRKIRNTVFQRSSNFFSQRSAFAWICIYWACDLETWSRKAILHEIWITLPSLNYINTSN